MSNCRCSRDRSPRGRRRPRAPGGPHARTSGSASRAGRTRRRRRGCSATHRRPRSAGAGELRSVDIGPGDRTHSAGALNCSYPIVRHETFAASSASRYESRAIASSSRSATEGCGAAAARRAGPAARPPPPPTARPARWRRQPDVHPDHVRRQLELVLHAAHQPLRGHSTPSTVSGSTCVGAAPVARTATPGSPRRRTGPRSSRADGPPIQRLGALEVQPVDVLAGEAAGVRTGGGRDRAGEDRQRPEHEQPAHRPDDRSSLAAAASRARRCRARPARRPRSGSPSRG